jgi:DNA-binding transcriptional ArsR family regulator
VVRVKDAWRRATVASGVDNSGGIHNISVMEMQPDQLSTVFGALADPTRRAILARLADGDATVAQLNAPFAVSQPAISRHLKVLERAGLISRSRQATARLSHLEAEPLRDATAWLARYQAFWDESHERLDALLAALQVDQQEGNR